MDYLHPRTEFYGLPWTTNNFHDMPYRPLGNSGLRASNIGLGTWKIGYPETGDGSRINKKTAFEIFNRAVELGITFWDTANRYNNSSGNSERIIGIWMKENPDQRRNVILATKLFGCMDGSTPNHCRLSRLNIFESVYASLERMQVEYIDVLYFHAFDNETPVEESLESIEDLVRMDIIRYCAVSNFTVEHLECFRRAAEKFGRRCAITAVQNQYDILNGESPSYPGVLQYSAEHSLSFVAWSPLARGLLTERYLDLSKVGKGNRLYDEGTLEKDAPLKVMVKLKQLAALAHSWDMMMHALVIAYMLTLPGMGPVIPSASNVQQLESLAGAAKILMTEEQKHAVKNVLTASA